MKRFMDRDAVRLSPHVTEFLIDKGSAGKHYYDPIGAHFTLCHAAISLLLPPSWQDIPQLVCPRLKEFLGYHLNAPYTKNVPPAQYTVSLLNHLDRIDYYDPKWFYLRDGYRLFIVWEVIKEVLLWLVKRKRVGSFTTTLSLKKSNWLVYFIRIYAKLWLNNVHEYLTRFYAKSFTFFPLKQSLVRFISSPFLNLSDHWHGLTSTLRGCTVTDSFLMLGVFFSLTNP